MTERKRASLLRSGLATRQPGFESLFYRMEATVLCHVCDCVVSLQNAEIATVRFQHKDLIVCTCTDCWD
jgi:hypothetical protein